MMSPIPVTWKPLVLSQQEICISATKRTTARTFPQPSTSCLQPGTTRSPPTTSLQSSTAGNARDPTSLLGDRLGSRPFLSSFGLKSQCYLVPRAAFWLDGGVRNQHTTQTLSILTSELWMDGDQSPRNQSSLQSA
ncbi:unnamed protein product [Eretmochelys imbricata]